MNRTTTCYGQFARGLATALVLAAPLSAQAPTYWTDIQTTKVRMAPGSASSNGWEYATIDITYRVVVCVGQLFPISRFEPGTLRTQDQSGVQRYWYEGKRYVIPNDVQPTPNWVLPYQAELIAPGKSLGSYRFRASDPARSEGNLDNCYGYDGIAGKLTQWISAEASKEEKQRFVAGIRLKASSDFILLSKEATGFIQKQLSAERAEAERKAREEQAKKDEARRLEEEKKREEERKRREEEQKRMAAEAKPAQPAQTAQASVSSTAGSPARPARPDPAEQRRIEAAREAARKEEAEREFAATMAAMKAKQDADAAAIERKVELVKTGIDLIGRFISDRKEAKRLEEEQAAAAARERYETRIAEMRALHAVECNFAQDAIDIYVTSSSTAGKLDDGKCQATPGAARAVAFRFYVDSPGAHIIAVLTHDFQPKAVLLDAKGNPHLGFSESEETEYGRKILKRVNIPRPGEYFLVVSGQGAATGAFAVQVNIPRNSF